jgi:hypothetical protein
MQANLGLGESMTAANRRQGCLILLLGLHWPAFSSNRSIANAVNTFHQLAGEYSDGGQKVTLHADGRLVWESLHVPVGTDAGTAVTATSKARLSADSMSLVVDGWSFASARGGTVPAQAKALLPSKLYLAKTLNLIFLLDEKSINDIANQVNAFGRSPMDASLYLHRVQSGTEAIGSLQIEPEALVPRNFSHRILSAPLQGKILTIEDVTGKQVNVAGWMQPPVWRTQYSAQLAIDLGSSRGVFQGMRLYVGSARQGVLVQRVQSDTCQARIVWIDVAPQVGDGVSSALK